MKMPPEEKRIYERNVSIVMAVSMILSLGWVIFVARCLFFFTISETFFAKPRYNVTSGYSSMQMADNYILRRQELEICITTVPPGSFMSQYSGAPKSLLYNTNRHSTVIVLCNGQLEERDHAKIALDQCDFCEDLCMKFAPRKEWCKGHNIHSGRAIQVNGKLYLNISPPLIWPGKPNEERLIITECLVKDLDLDVDSVDHFHLDGSVCPNTTQSPLVATGCTFFTARGTTLPQCLIPLIQEPLI